jgi:hypothetical protein
MSAPSAIERFLYGSYAEHVTDSGAVGNHCLLEFASCYDPRGDQESIRIRIAPRSNPQEWTTATFRNSNLYLFQFTSHDPENCFMPWYIRGFLCEGGPDRWAFNLHCAEVRLNWGSDWPTIEGYAANP